MEVDLWISTVKYINPAARASFKRKFPRRGYSRARLCAYVMRALHMRTPAEVICRLLEYVRARHNPELGYAYAMFCKELFRIREFSYLDYKADIEYANKKIPRCWCVAAQAICAITCQHHPCADRREIMPRTLSILLMLRNGDIEAVKSGFENSPQASKAYINRWYEGYINGADNASYELDDPSVHEALSVIIRNAMLHTFGDVYDFACSHTQKWH